MRYGLLLLPILCAGGAGAAPGVGRLAYFPDQPPGSKSMMLAACRSQEIRVVVSPPAKVTLPKCASKKPLYGVVDLGSAGRVPLLLFDESHGTGTGYDTVYVDANLNRDFTDERPAPRSKKPGYVLGTPFWLHIPFGARRMPCRAVVDKCSTAPPRDVNAPPHPAINGRGEGERYRLRPHGYYAGTVLFGKRLRRVALIDGNGNGRYTDVERCPVFGGDRILVDLNNNGLFERPRTDPYPSLDGPEGIVYGKRIFLDDQFWDLSVRPDGSGMQAVPTRAKLGVVKCDLQDARITLIGGDCLFCLPVSSGQFRVPVGKYQMMAWSCVRQDRQGQAWRVRGGRWGSLVDRSEIKVAATGAAWLKFGGPSLVSEVWARPGYNLPSPGSVLFEIMLHTPTCHMVSDLVAVTRPTGFAVGSAGPGPGRPRGPALPKPHLQITDLRGAPVADVLCTTRFNGYLWGEWWTPPPHLKGKKLKATTRFDGWPFPVKPKSCTFTVKVPAPAATAKPKGGPRRAPAR